VEPVLAEDGGANVTAADVEIGRNGASKAQRILLRTHANDTLSIHDLRQDLHSQFDRIAVSRENGGVTLQTNFNAGELRYVRNIPGGRRQRAPPDGAAVVIFQLTPPHLRTYVDQCCERNLDSRS
jgi:hypothetical protein